MPLAWELLSTHIPFLVSAQSAKIMSFDVEGKIAIAKEKKELGDQAFKTGELKDGEY